MPGVRNSAIAAGIQATKSVVAVFTVPADHVLLLKSVEVYNESALTATVRLAGYRPANGTTIYPVVLELQPQSPGHWSGWLALNAGDLLSLDNGGMRLHYWLGGALLPSTTV